MKLEFSRQILEKYLNINFHENRPFVAGLYHTDGRTERRTDMMKLVFALRNFTDARSKAVDRVLVR